jgi:diadenosine tetraphosphate (Ap4A) HIT family hydrolase
LGEAVPHAHIHILPQDGEAIKGIKFTEVLSVKKEELEKLAQQIENSF